MVSRNEVNEAMQIARGEVTRNELVEAIKAFDKYKGFLYQGRIVAWQQQYDGKGKWYSYAAIVAEGRFYTTWRAQRVGYTWDEMVTEWVYHGVTPDDIDLCVRDKAMSE